MITASSHLCGKISAIIDPEVSRMRAKLFTISAIIFALAMFRLLPHLPNVSPVAAMALFGGAYYADKRMAFLVPFLALFLSDLVLGLHNSMIFVYAGFALTVAIGFLLKGRVTITNTAFATVISSVLFFLLTNLGAWMTSGLYARSAEGLMQAYVAGIPFFQNSLLGNVVFVAVIFGGYHLLQKNVSSLRSV
jgi:predicted Co/Zn/Cd cation transporter (cation efflux family)